MEFLARLGLDTGGFERWGLHFAGLEHWLGWALLAALLLGGALWMRSSVKELNTRLRRYSLFVLQSVGLLLVVFALSQPAIRLVKVARIKDRVAVMLDLSESMSLPAGKGAETRLESALEFFDDNRGFFVKLEKDYAVTYHAFDRDVVELAGMPGPGLAASGPATDIGGAVAAAADESSGARLAGLIIVSDGSDTTRLGRWLSGEGAAGAEDLFSEFPSPVNTVVVGEPGAIKDMAILEVRHDDYGFVHNPFEVVAVVSARGGLSSSIPVVFKQGDQVLSTETITLEPGQEEATATLRFTPRQVGEFMFGVEIPLLDGEATTKNNLVRFPLKVLRDKVRALYVVGNPSWDERFLRQTLKKNPSVDLVSFYILREHWDTTAARQEEVSLIPFPTHELFTKELDTFDMVIWQDFRGPTYMMANYHEYMTQLNRFVKERGGALLMIGGHRGFFGAGRLDPGLLELLPVEPVDAVPNYLLEETRVELTPEGVRHPIMAVGEAGEDPASVWAGLPAISGYNRVKGTSPGGLALLAHPFAKGGQDNLPLVAIKETGAGRVMAVMTDCSWQWNFLAVGEGGSAKPYQRFYENALRWLLRDPEMRLITISAEKGTSEPGLPLDLVIEVLDETYEPTDKAELSLEVIEQPQDGGLEIPAPERIGRGKYRVTVSPRVAGAYRVRASAELAGRSLGQDDEVFEAEIQSAEWRDVVPRPELLAAISRATAGSAISADGDVDDLIFRGREVEQIIGTRDYPLWDNWAVFGLTFLVLVAGWYWRRKWGLR